MNYILLSQPKIKKNNSIFVKNNQKLDLQRSKYFGPPRSRYKTQGLSQFWVLSASHFASVSKELQAILHGFP